MLELYVPNKVKVFNLMSGVNKNVDWGKMYIIQRKKWKHDKCLCECKELDDWSSCKEGLHLEFYYLWLWMW